MSVSTTHSMPAPDTLSVAEIDREVALLTDLLEHRDPSNQEPARTQ